MGRPASRLAGSRTQLETVSVTAGPEGGVSRSEMVGLARGGAGNLAGAAFSALAGVGIVLVVTRTAPLAESGTFFALTSLFLILAALSRLGTPTGIVYHVARLRALGDSESSRRVIRMALVPAAAVAVACVVLVIGAARPVIGLLGLDPDLGTAPLIALALFLPFAVLSEGLLAGTRGLGVMRTTVLLERLGRMALQLVLVVIAAGTGSVLLLALAWAVPYVPTVALAARSLHRMTPQGSRRTAEGAPSRRAFWRFTAPCAVTSLVQIALQRLDILLVAGFLGPAWAAVYTAATRFVVVGQLGNQAVSLAAQPRLAVSLAGGDVTSTNTVYRTATAWLVLLNWPFFLLCIVYADQMLALFGLEADRGGDVVLVLAITMLVASACGMVDMVLSMSGRTSMNLYNNSAALAVAIGVDIYLIPRIGILGAAAGWAAAILVRNVVPLLQIFTRQRLHPFGAGPAIALGLSGTAFGLLPGLAVAAGPSWSLPVATALGAVLFAAGCWLWRAPLHLVVLAEALRRPAKRDP